jgi:hypothetical protein
VNRPSTSPAPRRRRVLALALASALALSVVVSVGTASAAKTNEHCVARVIGRSESGELQLSTPVCYSTYSAVLANAGGSVGTKRAGSGGGVTTMSGGTFIIGSHFDGAGFSGASFSVEGVDCYGGYLNLTGWWANRVSSTINGCPTITHFVWPNLVGGSENTTGFGGNPTSLDNLSESIRYAGW